MSLTETGREAADRESADRILAKVVASIAPRYKDDPLVREAFGFVVGLKDTAPKTITPRLAYGLRVLAACAVSSEEESAFYCNGISDDSPLNTYLRAIATEYILNSEIFFWRADVTEALDNSGDLPTFTVQPPQFPFSPSIHFFERHHDSVSTYLGRRPWYLFIEDEAALDVVYQSEVPDGKLDAHRIARILKWGQRFPDVTDTPATGKWARTALKMASFLRSTYIEIEPSQLSRADRRRLERASLPSPEMRIVKLRLPTSGGVGSPGSSRDFSHRWWVRGHHRNQWHPSTQTHAPAWIAPYIKGPEGKPFVKKVYDVVR